MVPPEPRAAPRRLLSPPVVFLLLVLAGYSLIALSPGFRQRLGLADGGLWFMDSYAVLAANDAVRAGLDPFLPNPLDVFQRPHVYSRWWFMLGDFGFTRRDNFVVGGSWVLLFAVAVMALLRPPTQTVAVWYALLVLSPPVQLAVLRASNDLVIFFLLTAAVRLVGPATWRLLLSAAALVLATGLKFYPLLACPVYLLVRPPRRMLAAGGLATLAAGLALASVWGDLRRAQIPSPNHIHIFGAPIIFRDLGWSGPGATVAGVLVVAGLAGMCLRHRWTADLMESTGPEFENRAFLVGAAVLVGCFLAGISHAYRLVFVLLLAPWLCRQCFAVDARQRIVVRLLSGLMLATLWADGLVGLGFNTLGHADSPAELERWLRLGHALTQPLIWAAMALLTGSLFAVAFRAWTDVRKSLQSPG
jgi:hypothetical protein